ncbi:MAG TPA: hypothetical protein VFJ94_00110 [Intrasporangium sp.]|uniref:hypothetical protein n=1 Tax=Intrasporangium sp. TaxID=1925024 RepID=UPI002D773253|nr:hypothetical protein [Intrasporangium sp.]HET7396898.1 hypothetical protein [Intrasporangium sp.]
MRARQRWPVNPVTVASLALVGLLPGCGTTASTVPVDRAAPGAGAPAAQTSSRANGQAGEADASEVCAEDARAVSLPATYPDAARLPAGYVITSVEARSGDRTVVSAVSPRGFQDTLGDLRAAFSTRGWTLSGGEVEEGDAESNFSGNGYKGRWGIRALPGCQEDTTVSVVLGR